MNTPTKTIALEEAGTLGGTLSEVDSQELVKRLLKEHGMTEVEADTLGGTLGDVESEA